MPLRLSMRWTPTLVVVALSLISLAGASAVSAAGAVGDGTLEAAAVTFGNALRFEEDIGAAGFDRLLVRGATQLAGSLVAQFEAGVAAGSYGFLRADNGGAISGTFSQVLSNLDPAVWQLSVVYGTDQVTLNVSAVPEPATFKSLAYALVLLGAWLRTSKRRPD